MAYRCANTDRISHLPSEIIEKILILLPCREAVRTSILSSDWRYKWISMTDLNFGGEPWEDEDKHARFINECLLRHQGPIRKFSVTVHSSTIGRRLKQWLKLVSKHDIEEVKVAFEYRSVIFPSRLLNLKKLTHLELSGCLLDVPPTFEGFMNLKVLDLSRIEVKDKSSIESLISRSPLLESLSLHEVSRVSDFPITISALKMKYLSMRGDLESIGLEKSPELVDMSLSLVGDSRDSDLIKILGGAPNLEKLAVRLEYPNFEHVETIGYYREVLSTTFSYLKVITLYGFDLAKSTAISVVLELLRSAPILEKVFIHNVHSFPLYLQNEADPDFCQKEYLVGHCFMKLKVVEMGSLLCMAPEIEFVKFILSNSPFLEKMTIGTRIRNLAIQTHMEELIRTHLLEELQALPRASTQVAVTFHDRKIRWRPNCG